LAGLASGIEDQLEILRADGLDVDADVRPLISIAENLRSHIAGMDKRLRAAALAHPVCSNLMTVPASVQSPPCPFTAPSAIHRAFSEPAMLAPISD
jgi:hypothetical protein